MCALVTGVQTCALPICPLPRREYTKRDDYNVLIGINRHTITPNGWTHEQFNTKALRKPDGSQVELPREFGFNDYQKVDDIDFQPAYDSVKAPSGIWDNVRARGDGSLLHTPGVYMRTRTDGLGLTTPLL